MNIKLALATLALSAASFAQGLALPPASDPWWQSATGKAFIQRTQSAPGFPHSELPDPKLTPGATDPHVTQATIDQTICKAGYTATVRNVTEAEKKAVMVRYGLPLSELHLVEIDHYRSLEIGGSNDVTNLWPQYYDPAKGQTNYLGARQKDVVETWLHRQICSGSITLDQAQEKLDEWPDVYRQIKAGQ